MGNIMDSVPTEHDRRVEITKEILDELKDLTETVDHSLAGLVKSVDSMQAACEMLLSQYESGKRDSLDSYSEDGTKSDKTLALYLLRTINESVYDHKFIAIGTFMKLLKYITEKINKHVKRNFGDKLNRTVDKYSKSKLKELPKDSSITYCDSRIEELWKDIGRLKRINSSQKKQIQLLNTKEEEFSDENGTLNETITTLENQARKLEEEIFAIEKDRSEIVKENEEKELKIWNLKKEIERLNNCMEREKENEKLLLEEKEKEITEKDNNLIKLREKIERKKKFIDEVEQKRLAEKREFQENIKELKSENERLVDDKLALQEEVKSINRKKIMQVQMNNIGSTMYGDVMKNLLKSKIETPDLKLEITTPASPKHVKTEIPTLYAITAYDRLKSIQSKVAEETRGIKDTAKAVLLIVHNIYRDSEVCSIASSEVALKEHSQTLESFGGIFDMAFNYRNNRFSSCELNDRSIEEIVKFVQNEGVKLSRWKIFLDSVNEAESEKTFI